MNKLSGKVAIVTGSSQGIGKAIALELLRSGALVTLNARNKEKLGQTLRLELRPRGVHIGLVMVGLTDFDEDKRVVASDGSLIQIRRGAHQTREQVAKIVLKTITRKKFQVVLTPLGKINSIAQRISPALVEWVINRSGRTAAYNQ